MCCRRNLSSLNSSVRRAACAALAFACFAVLTCAGCGAFAVEGGLYPLPAIHLIDPLPWQCGLTYEDVRLTAANGQTMYAWYIPADENRATIIMHHGAVANRSSGLTHARFLHSLGCNVFLYDYEGFGESWAIATLNTILPDANVALQYVQNRSLDGSPPIIIFGASLGTLPTFAQAATNPAGVVGMVAEGSCVPRDLPTNAFFNLGITPSPEAFLKVPTYLDPDVNVPLITMPKLFIHSREDTTTPFAGGEGLYDEAVEPKEFAEVTGGHLAAVDVDTENYRTIWSGFLDELLPLQP